MPLLDILIVSMADDVRSVRLGSRWQRGVQGRHRWYHMLSSRVQRAFEVLLGPRNNDDHPWSASDSAQPGIDPTLELSRYPRARESGGEWRSALSQD